MYNSRVDKYRKLREGIKDEVGINRNQQSDNDSDISEEEKDDFLESINRSFIHDRQEAKVEDTLTEAKTYSLMQKESNEEINRALKNAKAGVGKSGHYNTKMDILNKIREPEKEVIRLNKFDNVSTSQFSKGFFVNGEAKLKTEERVDQSDEKKMTLLERLASMSPEEDVKKAKIVIGKESFTDNFEDEVENDEVNDDAIEQTKTLEDMLRQIKEKDQREVAKVLAKQDQEEVVTTKKVEEKVVKQEKSDQENSNSEKVATILNYIIIILMIVFLGLCAMIGYQLFF